MVKNWLYVLVTCSIQQYSLKVIKNSIVSLHKKTHYPPGIITILATSKHILFPGPYHLLTTSTDGGPQAIIKVLGHQYRWLAGDYMTWK